MSWLFVGGGPIVAFNIGGVMNNARFDYIVNFIKENPISRVWLERGILSVGADYPAATEGASWIPVGTYSSANFRPEYLREDVRFAEQHPEPALD